jgi:hypothetical protein
MNCFQLDRHWLAAQRQAEIEVGPPPTVVECLWRGALGGMILSVAGFVPWAITGRWLYRAVGEPGLYAVCAVVFIGLSGPLLHRLLTGPRSMSRFYRLFGVAFAAYSLAWIAGWMAFRGHTGSLAGLLAGALAMAWIFIKAFGVPCKFQLVATALFIPVTVGYFLGGAVEGWLMSLTHGSKFLATGARLSWGVCFGLGFGMGLGFALHVCQARVREQPVPADPV